MDLGVKALGTHPLKSVKKGVGERRGGAFSGVRFVPGAYLRYADEDGVICSACALSPAGA